jgi:hypothetical protein
MNRPPQSQRELVLAEAIERLAQIQQRAGFNTDAGEHVFLGETPQLGKDDPDAALAIVVGDDEATAIDSRRSFRLVPLEIQAVIKVGRCQGWITVEQMLADIKRAFETEDRRLLTYPQSRGATRTLPREEGSTVAGVGITYFIDMAEAWGLP